MKQIRRVQRLLLLAIALLFSFTVVNAQQTTGDAPPEFDLVLANLSQRLRANITVDDLTEYQWEQINFPDTSLGCAVPGRTYNQVITPGYQFLVTYSGTVYDYRVAEGGGQITLCDTRPVVPDPTPTPPTDTTCDDQYVVEEEDFLLEIARECNTTIAALLNANPDITNPSLIYVGQVLTIPDGEMQPEVSIRPDSGPPGTFIQIFASGFPPGAQVEIGVGPPASEYVVIATREIGADGELVANLQISPEIEPPEERVAVVVLNNEETVSEPFNVTTEAEPTPTPPEGVLFEEAQIYLVALGDEGRSGQEFGCGDSLIPVTVNFEPTIAPLTAALGEMFDIDERTYGQSGLYNALYQSDLSVDGIDIENQEAIIELSGTLQTGGVCDEPRVIQQIEQTALQFSTINSVSITLNGEALN
jgi:LysM repeat protein